MSPVEDAGTGGVWGSIGTETRRWVGELVREEDASGLLLRAISGGLGWWWVQVWSILTCGSGAETVGAASFCSGQVWVADA